MAILELKPCGKKYSISFIAEEGDLISFYVSMISITPSADSKNTHNIELHVRLLNL